MDWQWLTDTTGIRFPNVWIDSTLKELRKWEAGAVRHAEVPSSFAGEVYDRCGVPSILAAFILTILTLLVSLPIPPPTAPGSAKRG